MATATETKPERAIGTLRLTASGELTFKLATSTAKQFAKTCDKLRMMLEVPGAKDKVNAALLPLVELIDEYGE